ncbi:hypothetical protein ADK60_24875, partial [Streptomyces sp. XY431]|uniref:condensation domain-containing protein n=1 Tax=Streptomyces sp. XY431 TaxID=1415562 RepID=UPI0006C580AF
LDVPALSAALTDVVQRHETLRTVFPEHDGTPHQVVLEDPRTWPTLTTTIATPDQLQHTLQQAAAHPFDLTTEPPLRAHLIAQPDHPHQHHLLLVLHHIAGDGWSTAPLANDLTTAYTARLHHQPPTWEPLPVQYIDYPPWQHQLLGDPHDPTSLHHQQLTHWRHTLT